MEAKMHFQFLIEDQSSAKLIDAIMLKVIEQNPTTTYDSKYFLGIGGFTKRNTVKETKTGKLLNDLATYLRGFNKSLKNINAAVFIILDNDDRNSRKFQKELKSVACQAAITIDHVFCIAIEETEAWLLGDKQAILASYPQAKISVLNSYKQDSICGTWEALADIIYKGGLKQMKKDCPTYMEKGKLKTIWAQTIGACMDLSCNKSPSFNFFISEIDKRLKTVDI